MNNISCDPVFSLASADPWPLWGSQEVTFHLSCPKKISLPRKQKFIRLDSRFLGKDKKQ